jgi:alpha-glucosidase (family GH31 glycosyl hydrolase)
MCRALCHVQGAWYSLWDYARLDSNGTNITLDVPQGDIAVHLRGGSIIPLQVRPWAPMMQQQQQQQQQVRGAEPCAPMQQQQQVRGAQQ